MAEGGDGPRTLFDAHGGAAHSASPAITSNVWLHHHTMKCQLQVQTTATPLSPLQVPSERALILGLDVSRAQCQLLDHPSPYYQ